MTRKRKREYRYRDHAGSTRRSLEAIQHLPKIGFPQYVRGYCHASRFSDGTPTKRVAVLVRGSKGSIRFECLNWGYGGTGPCGLRELFSHLRVPDYIANFIAHDGIKPSPDYNKVRNFWKLVMRNDGGYDLYLYDEHGNVTGHHKYSLQEVVVETPKVQLRMLFAS